MRTTMSPSPVFLGVLAGVLALVGPVIGQADQCPAGPNIAGIVIGSILGTLAVVGIIIAIIFFIRWKKRPKKARAATKTGDAGLEQAHVNPAFQADDSTTTGQHPDKANDVNFAEQGFAGYVPCKEFEHAVKKEPTRSNGSLGRATSPLVAKLPMHNFGTKLTKSGSHGSLDDSYPSLAMHSSAIELSKIRSLDPEVINVPLQSQDIIGLGFNICGNLRDGIFVSQVLNRGPASESRLIKPGDRILGITISFENMVYEDALTILSYASPYPVKLQVQKKSLKASDPDVTGDDYEEALHLHHPKYRSQSMDDVSKIAQESVSRMRRAWSEMKRGSSKRKQEEEKVIVEENRLRRWSGKPNHGEPVGDAGSDEKSDNSTVSIPDLHIDTTDLMASYNSSGSNKGASTEVTVHQEPEAVELVVVNLDNDEIILEEITLNQTEAPTLGLSPKRQAEADRKEGLRLSYEVDRPIRKLDLEEAPDLELKKGGFGVHTDDMDEVNLELPNHGLSIARPDSPDLGLAVKRPESPDLEFSLARRDSQNSHSSSRNSPSPVILTGNMGLDLKIGAAFEDTPDVPVVLVPDVGQEVAIGSEQAYSPVIVTEHDEFLDIDLQNAKISTGHTDSSSPPPSPPPGPPPLLSDDNAADVTESSMLVLVNEESILRRDDGSGTDETEPVEGHALGDHEDDSVHAMLKDYFSDQPSLMERLGLSKPATLEGNTEEVVLPKRLSSDSKASGHEPLLDEHIENSRVLQKAKEAIRRRSSSSEEEPHVSSPSTLSSRSSSPAEPHLADDQYILEQGDATTPPKERKRKSHSPLVKKRSTGGLMYDISSSEYHEMAVDVPEKDITNPPGGVAYFVSIDEHFHGAPLSLRAEDDEGLEEEEVDQPSLVKAWGLPNMSGHYNLGHDHDHGAETSKQVNEVVTIDTRDDGPTSIITETRTTTVTLSNNNNESGMNGKGGDSPIGSPLKSTKELVTTTEVSKSNEVITVTRHEEIQGAYTLTVNASSHNDDSEA